MLSIIVAVDQNNAIGCNNELLCYLPDDLKYFKSITIGKPVVMGRLTYCSLPRRPLPERRNIVLTTQENFHDSGIEVARSVNELLQLVVDEKEVFVIGGGSVYEQFLPIADKLYITHIEHSFEGADTFFPEIDSTIWKKTSEKRHAADEKHAYSFTFVAYERI